MGGSRLGSLPFLYIRRLLIRNAVATISWTPFRVFATDSPPPAICSRIAPSKVGTPRWGLQVYDGSLETDSMSKFLEDAATADAKQNTPITRLPTVMTRKEPKVKPPPPPPPPPRTEPEGTAQVEGEGAGEGGAYEGWTREQILEEFRLKQAEREAARRKVMDEEV